MKKVLYLENLDCNSCCLKIEESLNKVRKISNVELNFNTKTLSFRTEDEGIISKVKELIHFIEPNIKISNSKNSNKNFMSNLDKKKILLIFIYSLILLANYIFFDESYLLQTCIYFIIYILTARDIIKKAFNNLRKGGILDENFLMSVATFGAFLIGEYLEGIAVVLLYKVGEIFKSYAVNNSRDLINALIDLKPKFANLKLNNKIIKKEPKEIRVGDTILVRKGESVPLDSILLSDFAYFDSSSINGEFYTNKVKKGERVFSSYINISDPIYLKVEAKFENSMISKIIELVKSASLKKAKSEELITKFAKVYTPIVIFLAFICAFIPPIFLEDKDFLPWIHKALIFLIISCPCALVISIPLSFFAGLGSASKNGILVKGSNYLEKLNEINQFVFDKTGTLTKGDFTIKEIIRHCAYTKSEILDYLALCESFSTHPIAKSITKTHKSSLDLSLLKSVKELSGLGIVAKIDNSRYLLGNEKLLKKYKVDYKSIKSTYKVIYLAKDKKLLASILMGDSIKKESFTFIKNLKKMKIDNTYILTGDNYKNAKLVSESLGISSFKAGLMPSEKVSVYDKIKANYKSAFIGDGINDAPVLAKSDLGICLRGNNNDISMLSADIIINGENINKVYTALKIAKETKNIVYQNITFSLLAKVSILILGTFGFTGMKGAIIADVGATLVAIANASRILYINFNK